jgi:hypothetical protein
VYDRGVGGGQSFFAYRGMVLLLYQPSIMIELINYIKIVHELIR